MNKKSDIKEKEYLSHTMASLFNFKCFLDEQKNENKEKTKTKTPFLKTKLARCTG
ncbi:hypothetical protein ACTS91_03730 [Empedobacter falsenii]|uniref:hypothetical protein n=1 Tax=Empedobacter TaxID=59734 RepID=UPI0015DF0142|nr:MULTISPECIES: hypothetical protein [Empedobacter]MDH1884211.1 hypothetical protein [Empedobacter sp. GD03797]MDH2205538.1 hypothetical protein [Empedobacter sp. GD03644]MDM1043221.1 hypothetical protein [Empedobacter brevis]MDM1137148.1 hypothetical protein [Empedobacter sp. R750]